MHKYEVWQMSQYHSNLYVKESTKRYGSAQSSTQGGGCLED